MKIIKEYEEDLKEEFADYLTDLLDSLKVLDFNKNEELKKYIATFEERTKIIESTMIAIYGKLTPNDPECFE